LFPWQGFGFHVESAVLIQVEVAPALAFRVAEAVERYRVAATVNGGSAPIGLAEVRDVFLDSARSRQEPSNQQNLVDLFDAVLVTPRLLRISQVVTALASSTRTVERLIASGALPTVLVGAGSVRVRLADLDAYVESLARVRKGAVA
jgi:excisionase family DNA binding protein